jgi:circadian clock protein KaiC
MTDKVAIGCLGTSVPGLDDLLGGGLPEFSFNLIAGTPGSGKTTLAHQIMFSLANADRRALFFTVLGESPLKMLRYQQQFSFFDVDKVNRSIKFVNLAADLLDGDFDRVLARITEEVQNFSPSMVFVDSFRSVAQSARAIAPGTSGLQQFVQRLGMLMTSWQATTFLIGEYLTPEAESSPIFTVADGIIWMSQNVHRDAMTRKIQVVKMRGQAQSPGVHTFRIGNDGLKIFSRAIFRRGTTSDAQIFAEYRLSMGIPALDEMMGGGLPAGYSLLLVGPSGAGKSVLATRFLAEGVRAGESGVLAAFGNNPNHLFSPHLDQLIRNGKIGVIDTPTPDLSLDEILNDLVTLIKKMKATRVVIDSLSGFELALAPVFRENFREALYRLIAALTGMGVTVLMTAEQEEQYSALRFGAYGIAFLADAILMQRYVEIGGQIKRVISVVKVRGSAHSEDIRFFDIDNDKLSIGGHLTGFHGILSGQPDSAG